MNAAGGMLGRLQWEVLHKDPYVILIHNFLRSVENEYLLRSADGSFQDSRTTCEKPEGCVTDYRTSSSAFLENDDVTETVSNRALAFASLGPEAVGEELQVVRYTEGQEFKGHLDSLDDSSPEGRRDLERYQNKQRTATALVYLNDNFNGGATYFPRLGLAVKPVRNAALFWWNLLPNGEIDRRTYHGGQKVSGGTKYAVNIWLRGGRVRAVAPRAAAGLARGMVNPMMLGELTHTLEGDGKKFGVPVLRKPYALSGTSGVKHTLQEMGRMIRQSSVSPAMRSFAEMVIRKAGIPPKEQISDRKAGQIFLDYVRSNVRYRPDPSMTEYVIEAPVTLCIPGAPMCIPVGDCFPEGTLLLRDDYKLVPIEKIKIGERIWGRDQWTTVRGKAHKGKLMVDAVEMNNGSTMYLTRDHKVYVGKCKHDRGAECPSCSPTKRQEKFERMTVGDLQVGEALLQPKKIAFGESTVDPDRAYVEGLALADGWVRDNLKCFYVAGRDGMRKEKQKHEVAEICKKLGIETKWHKRYIVVYDQEWATRIAELGSRARFKHLDTLNLSEATAEAYLRGLMADSTANTNSAVSARTYSTTSPELMVQVRLLHRMFGASTSVKMLTPEQHGGAGKHPLWRVGVRKVSKGRAEKTLAVRAIERSVKKVPCWDIQTEDHYVYLPEHDVTVSNCDDLSIALGSLMAAYGMNVRLMKQNFGDDGQEHVLVLFEDSSTSNGLSDGGGVWLAADPSAPDKPVGWKMPGASEVVIDPSDPSTLGLVDAPAAEFVSIGRLPTSAKPLGFGQATPAALMQTQSQAGGISVGDAVVNTALFALTVGTAWGFYNRLSKKGTRR